MMEKDFESPDTEPLSDLDPTPGKPATADTSPAPSDGEKPLAVRAWRRRPPTLIASAVTTLFDVLDLIGDTIAEKTGIRSQA